MTQPGAAFRLPPLPKISDLIRLYGLSAKKQLSQNFILDLNITDKIARVANVFDCYVCEVGAGPGSLTRSLLQNHARHVAAVEIDKRFLPSLKMLSDASMGRMSVHHGDIMNVDIPGLMTDAIPTPWDSDDLPGIRLLGNLPFSVAIPLHLQWLEALSKTRGVFKFGRVPMYLVFQKEVGQDMTAEPFEKRRSRLSVMTQNLCSTKIVYNLPREVFVPEPKVDACLLEFLPKKKPEISAPFVVVEQVVKATFSLKRKFIRNSLRCLFPKREDLTTAMLSRADIDPEMRSYQLDFEHYNKLCEAFIAICTENDMSLTPLKMSKPTPIPE